MVSFKHLILCYTLATGSLATSLSHRTIPGAYNECKSCTVVCNTLKNDCNAYTGTSAQFNAITQDFNNLSSCCKKLYTEISSTPQTSVNPNDYNALLQCLTNPLEPCFQAALAALKNKKNVFIANGVYAQVQQSLKMFNEYCCKLVTDALIKAAPNQQQYQQAQSISAKINADCKDALAYFP